MALNPNDLILKRFGRQDRESGVGSQIVRANLPASSREILLASLGLTQGGLGTTGLRRPLLGATLSLANIPQEKLEGIGVPEGASQVKFTPGQFSFFIPSKRTLGSGTSSSLIRSLGRLRVPTVEEDQEPLLK